MANPYLNLYKNNPTAGGNDGTAISTGDNTAPLTFVLDTTNNESASDTIAARCETGYQTFTSTTISTASDTSNFWQLSLDGTNWADSVIISDTITDSNTTFFVKASSSSSETPHNDTSVKIAVSTVISAV